MERSWRIDGILVLLWAAMWLVFGCGETPLEIEENDAANEPVQNQPNNDETVDPPETVIEAGPSAVTPDTTAVFEFSADTQAADFECRLNATEWEACQSPLEYMDLTPGEYLFEVRAVVEGVVDDDPPQWNWEVVEEGQTQLLSYPDELTNESHATFEFLNEVNSRFECRLNEVDWDSCDSPQTYEDIADGEHLFAVRAIDEHDQPVESPLEYGWQIDTVPPETSWLETPNEQSESTEAIFEFEADKQASFECRLNEESWYNCDSPQELVDLDAGEHLFEVRATDEAGNIEDPTVAYSWRVVQEVEWRDVATGANSSCGITQAGTMYCWGSNASQKLGQPEVVGEDNRPWPQQVGEDEDWREVVAALNHTCALREDDTLWCWGNRRDGALGDGEEAWSTYEPQQVGTGQWDSVDIGAKHDTGPAQSTSCGIRTDGTLWCWGNNEDGQLGQEDLDEYDDPVQVGDHDDWESVSVNNAGVCAIRNGELYCWGFNPNDRLGVDSEDNRVVEPMQVGEDDDWEAISIGRGGPGIFTGGHICGIRSGELYCWGSTLGEQTSTPNRVGQADDWTSIRSSKWASCGLRNDADLWCFGRNASGQLGKLPGGDLDEPTRIGDADDWDVIDIASGDGYGLDLMFDPNDSHSRHGCGIRADGDELVCWGSNTRGQLGQGDVRRVAEPRSLGSDLEWATMSTGMLNTCAIDDEQQLQCWGFNYTTSFEEGYEYIPRQVGDDQWEMVASSRALHCGINHDAELWCWGNDATDIFGDGNQHDPVQVASDQSWSYVSTASPGALGNNPFVCAIDTDDELWCWGNNGNGQLGDGTTEDRSDPQKVDDSSWSQVDTSAFHSCGVRTDGTLWCWGSNNHGQLGNDAEGPVTDPIQVGVDDDWTNVTAGNNFTCGLRQSGQLECWGRNDYGQLGNGTDNSTDQPQLVGDEDDEWIDVAASSRHASRVCAVHVDGRIFCWGQNIHGSLGSGELLANEDTPTTVDGPNDFVRVDTGWAHTCGLESDGELHCWGADKMGQLGIQIGLNPSPQTVIP